MNDQTKPDLCAWCGCTVNPKAFSSRLMVLSGSLTRIAACSVVHMALWDKKASEDRERLLAAAERVLIDMAGEIDLCEDDCFMVLNDAVAKAKSAEVKADG